MNRHLFVDTQSSTASQTGMPETSVMAYKPGDIIDGSYKLTHLLGQGGMGVVFGCHHMVLDKDYALKLIYGAELTAEHWERFKDEAKALARLRHPNIVGIYNMGIDKGNCPFYVMDLLSGEALDTLVQSSVRLPVPLLLDLFSDVACALGSAHERGIIHRDVKPSNLMLVRDDKGCIVSVKVVDFGIARISETGATLTDQSKTSQSQTPPGIIFGTPFYMSPEQCKGAQVDHRSDIYSLGCAFFEALTGSPPFRGRSSFHTYILHQNEPPPKLAAFGLQCENLASLELAVAKMLAKNPDDRYHCMSQLKHDLERIKAGKSIVARSLSDGNSIAVGALSPKFSPLNRAGCLEKIGAVAGAICVLGVGAAMTAYFARPEGLGLMVQHSSRPVTQSSSLESFVDEMGADTDEVDRAMTDGPDTMKERHKFEQAVRPFITNPSWRMTKFKVAKPVAAFNFPREFAVGAIKVGDFEPVYARGVILAPDDKRVCLYLPSTVTEFPEIFAKFGPNDATGLEAAFRRPAEVIPTLAKWPRLDELSFFNSLLKALPNWEDWEESALTDADLPAIDKLTNLKSLGLCGPDVSGKKIAQMRLLSSLETLKLKRIGDQQALLDALPQHDNIKEIWLVGQNTTDEQLKSLTGMDNLETLRIRGSRLTPASLATFMQMKALKYLWLDRNSWSEADKERFKKAIPGCRFEKVLDYKFWYAVPK